jgi:hypothetical protein
MLVKLPYLTHINASAVPPDMHRTVVRKSGTVDDQARYAQRQFSDAVYSAAQLAGAMSEAPVGPAPPDPGTPPPLSVSASPPLLFPGGPEEGAGAGAGAGVGAGAGAGAGRTLVDSGVMVGRATPSVSPLARAPGFVWASDAILHLNLTNQHLQVCLCACVCVCD